MSIKTLLSGLDINVVLFDLKKGFKFFDKGHSNEQITWLISGSMDFYSGKLEEKLIKNKGLISAVIIHMEGYQMARLVLMRFFQKG